MCRGVDVFAAIKCAACLIFCRPYIQPGRSLSVAVRRIFSPIDVAFFALDTDAANEYARHSLCAGQSLGSLCEALIWKNYHHYALQTPSMLVYFKRIFRKFLIYCAGSWRTVSAINLAYLTNASASATQPQIVSNLLAEWHAVSIVFVSPQITLVNGMHQNVASSSLDRSS